MLSRNASATALLIDGDRPVAVQAEGPERLGINRCSRLHGSRKDVDALSSNARLTLDVIEEKVIAAAPRP